MAHTRQLATRTGLGYRPYSFLVITVLLAWAFWFSAAATGQGWLAFPNVILTAAGFITPLAVACAMVALGYWDGGLREFLNNCFNPANVKPRWFVVTGGLLLILAGGPPVLASLLFGRPVAELAEFDPPTAFVIIGFAAAVIEEPGWRGYAQRALRERRSTVVGSLIIGVFWALWHLPLFLIPGTYQSTMGLQSTGFVFFMSSILVGSLVYGRLYDAVGGFAVIAVLYHGFGNTLREVFSFAETGVHTQAMEFGVEALIALVVVVVLRPRLPRRPGRPRGPREKRSERSERRRLSSGTLLSVALLGLAGCTAGEGEFEPRPETERSAELEALTAEFDRELPRLLERYDVPGAAVALVRDGRPVWSGGYGYADLDRRAAVEPETVFEAGSIAKSITAWTVLRLVDQGKLALDDAVITHLPNAVAERFRAACVGGVPAETLTVRELISNSGGMPFAIGAGDLDDLREGRMDAEHLCRRAPSGERFEYSNPAFVVAALIVETVSDAPFAEVAEREVLEPLAMRNTGFGAQPRFADSAADGHSFDGAPVRWDDRGPLGAGGLYSTAEDLARLLAAYHAHHHSDTEGILSAGAYRAMLDPVIEVGGAYHSLMAEYYALGHFVDFLQEPTLDGESRDSPLKGVSHGGESTGWLTAYYTIPETGDGFVLLTNSRRSWPLMRLARTWVDAFGLPHPTMVRSYYRLRAAIIGFGVLSGMAAVGVLLVRLRRRRGASLLARIGAFSAAAAGAALLVGWWALAHGIVSMFFPVLVIVPAVGVTALALVLVGQALPTARTS